MVVTDAFHGEDGGEKSGVSEKVEEGGKSVTYVVLKAETIDKYGLKPRE